MLLLVCVVMLLLMPLPMLLFTVADDAACARYASMICGILDIPVYEGHVTQSLHVLFMLYDELRKNQGITRA